MRNALAPFADNTRPCIAKQKVYHGKDSYSQLWYVVEGIEEGY
jgi:hypothetical protein